jgi:hypothetical protein
MKPFIKELHDWIDELNVQVEAKHSKNPVVYPSLSSDESLVLRAIADEPFIYKTPLNKKLDLFGSLDDALSKLERVGFLEQLSYVGKTNNSFYFPLSEKAQDLLGIPKSDRVSPKFFKHSLMCFYVRRWLENNNLTALSEYVGKIRGVGRIDVYCPETDTAYEITRNTKNVAGNVRKCLGYFKVKAVVLVCENMKWANNQVLPELGTHLLPSELEDWRDKIRLRSVRDMILTKS